MNPADQQRESIAIIGMAGRFPKAKDIAAFWDNIRSARECISFFKEEELSTMGIEFPRPDSRAVKARGVLENADMFDAALFGINPREAEVMDPQQRLFLECAWEALENAGYDSEREERLIGVFGGTSLNTYFINTLMSRPELLDLFSAYQLMVGNDKDFLTTRVSYKLNLRGPSLNIQTACSTSLVAACVACQNLLTYQCDMALAGCVSVTFPQKQIHWYQGGGITSPDGHCRAFDEKAQGTVPGEGVGIVVLKRLSEALADGDQIYAVIKGFAMNNDGSMKAGYTAPSEVGQAEAIAWAQAMAGVDPATIGYVETHGTGTPLGDPIEIAGLTRAFRAGTEAKNFCAIGSVKTSIGHLDVAAGIAGLINATHALHHKILPPSLNFETPNPKIDFANSPFYVNTKATDWKAGATPRRAGVSSFGVGSTNAHVVLEEAPAIEPSSASRSAHLLVLSAKTQTALDAATKNLAEHLKQNSNVNLADAAYTLQVGRRMFNHRRALVCSDVRDAIENLEKPVPPRVFTKATEQGKAPVVFMFPGQGAQKLNMGRELYESEPVFRAELDRCAEILKPYLGLDLRQVIYPANEVASNGAPASSTASSSDESNRAVPEAGVPSLKQTYITQPALFAVEYSLAKLWMSWGIQPDAMIGHSVGEYVAACLAGVFTLEDALKLVANRGRMMQELPSGSMLAVRLSESEIQPLLNAQLSLAGVNGATQCVISGVNEAVDALQQQLTERGVACHRLETSHAFHSPMVDPALAPFTKVVEQVKLTAPKIPFISDVSATWITDTQATDPAYWAKHMRETVRFAAGMSELLKNPKLTFLEVGPGQTLTALTRQHPAKGADRTVASSLSGATTEVAAMLTGLGQLWIAGVVVDWDGFYANERRHRVALPAYAFERKRFWIEPAPVSITPRVASNGHREHLVLNGTNGETGEVRNGSTTDSTTSLANGSAAQPEDSKPPQTTVQTKLRNLFTKLLGVDLADMAGRTTFLEMGFDSLLLTQASRGIERIFGVRIPFAQLLAKYSTFDLLAEFVESSAVANKNGASAESQIRRTINPLSAAARVVSTAVT
ncbi:MAG: phthiocerol/phenolphthiocerol synthesis type-I polyketide synthase, partial [Verrucomicrobiota bacterium]